jgi:chitin synthase
VFFCYPYSQLVEAELKAWDMFRELPPEADHNDLKSETQMLKFLRFIKLIATFLIFIIVLGCGVIAKGTVLFMTSQIRIGQTVEHCNRELDFSKYIYLI